MMLGVDLNTQTSLIPFILIVFVLSSLVAKIKYCWLESDCDQTMKKHVLTLRLIPIHMLGRFLSSWSITPATVSWENMIGVGTLI